jgi:predicted enzyme related to lactoylglutathione lyase
MKHLLLNERRRKNMEDQFKTHGAFSWCELMTTDPEVAKGFYSELFGWELEEYPMEDMNYTVIRVAGQEMGGIMAIPPEAAGAPPNWSCYVTVDDVDATIKKAEAMQGKVLLPPRDVPDVGRFAVIQDPQGAVLTVIKYE